MGNTQNKVGVITEENPVTVDDNDLIEAVESLPKTKPLKSYKKPKGPKDRKPPSRTFLQAIVSYFQKSDTQIERKETPKETIQKEGTIKEPDLNIDLNVIKEVTVLENVTKGRPAPPSKRRRPVRTRKPENKVEEIELNIETSEDEAEPTKNRKEPKIFLKPPNKSLSTDNFEKTQVVK